MKTYYKIKEISTLYNIGPDSLRYYEELGILRPRRDANNYRLYTTSDIYRLNIIRDLRNLGFSMKRIKDYLENRSIEESMHIMKVEEQLIDKKINELQQMKKDVQHRLSSLKDSKSLAFDTIEIKDFPIRKCVSLSSDDVQDDIEYLLMKLSKEHEKNIYTIANFHTGYFLNADELTHIHPTSVFIVGDTLESYEFLLPKGKYVTMYYQGDHHRTQVCLHRMLSYCEQHGYEADSYLMEFCIIDAHETKNKEEYITQLQIKLKDQ